MSSRAGKLLTDVYRDLRDRRLLVIAAALVLAILAVPFVVKGSEPSDGGVTVATVPGGVETNELDPVVVSEPTELRDYRKRLGGLHPKNPFEQQLRATASALDAGGGGAGGGLATEESATASTETAATGASSSTSTSPAAVPAGESTSPAETGGPPKVGPDKPSPPVVEPVAVDFTIDVKVGPVGDTRVIRGVKQGDKLPGKKRPVLVYLGSEVDASGSTFGVSRDVVGTSGEGHCAPNRTSCAFLELEVGQEQDLELESTGATYRIKLLDVTRRERPLPAEALESE